MRYFFAFLALLLISSCAKKQEHTNKDIKVFGHGGMGNGSTLPMNSLESMLACYHTGAEGNELDIQLTKDSVIIAMHSRELSENTSLEGMVNALTWSEIAKGYYTENPYLKYNIVSLEQVFQKMNASNTYYFTLDCKRYPSETPNYDEVFTEQVFRLIEKYGLENRVLIESDNERFLQLLQEKNSALKLFIYVGTVPEGIAICERYGFYGITISTRNANKEAIQQVHERGLKIAIWNTHTQKDNREAVEKNPDFIQTEKINYLLDLLSK